MPPYVEKIIKKLIKIKEQKEKKAKEIEVEKDDSGNSTKDSNEERHKLTKKKGDFKFYQSIFKDSDQKENTDSKKTKTKKDLPILFKDGVQVDDQIFYPN